MDIPCGTLRDPARVRWRMATLYRMRPATGRRCDCRTQQGGYLQGLHLTLKNTCAVRDDGQSPRPDGGARTKGLRVWNVTRMNFRKCHSLINIGSYHRGGACGPDEMLRELQSPDLTRSQHQSLQLKRN
jgi:hypothetical protein